MGVFVGLGQVLKSVVSQIRVPSAHVLQTEVLQARVQGGEVGIVGGAQTATCVHLNVF